MRALAVSTALSLLAVSAPAYAKSGPYVGLAAGFGTLTGTNLVLTELGNDIPDTNPDTCCSSPGAAAEFRVGFDIGGWFAPEFAFVGHGFDLTSEMGGEGFIGGGLRIFPIGLIGLTGMDVKDIPILLSFGGTFGYTVVGRHFAYTGTFFGFDFTAEYRISEVFSLGARITVIPPSLGDFAYTDYNGNVGRCLDNNGQMTPTDPVAPKASLACNGSGPSTLYLSPTLSATFHFDVID